MKAPQMVGFGVTVLVVLGVDLPIGWLVVIGMLAGGVATAIVTYAMKARG